MKLEVKENKKLKLVNVLVKELVAVSIEDLNEEVKKFTNFLEMSKIQTRGPLVTKMKGTNISDIGEITTDYSIMIQTVRKVTTLGYKFYEEIVVNDCLYIHYDGVEEGISYVQSKLALHIWENEYIETGEEYSVHLENTDGNIIIDIFRPLERVYETI